jgi:hypothetical protein
MAEDSQRILRRFYNPSLRRLRPAFVDLGAARAVLPDGAAVDCPTGLSDVLCFADVDTIFCLNRGETDLLSFVQSSIGEGWRVDKWTATDNVNGGRIINDARTVYVSELEQSYFPKCESAGIAYQAFNELERIFLNNQKGFGHTLNLANNPTTTGLFLLHMSLPVGKEYPAQDEELLSLIAQFTTQSRTELLTPPRLKKIKNFYYFDARFMYAAAAFYELPAGEPVRDTLNRFEPYSVGWYRVRASVPSDWQHIGILPLRNPSEDRTQAKWLWPSEPGFIFDDILVTEPELRLAISHGWPVEIKERILWPDKNAKPLRPWQQRIVEMLAEADALTGDARPHVRYAVKSLLYRAIGSMGARKERQSYDISTEQFIAERREYTPDVRASMRFLDAGNIRVVKPKEKTAFRGLFSRYEWAAYVWARARVALTERMLSIPRASILGCRTDAVYLTERPDWKDSGFPGQFICKGHLAGTLSAPHTHADLLHLRTLAEEKGV